MGVDTIGGQVYQEAYKDWVNGMSYSERENLKKMGLNKPLLDRRATEKAFFDGDFVDLDPTDQYALTQWREAGLNNFVAVSEKRRSDWEFLERLVAEFLDAEDAILARDCFLFITGAYLRAGVTLTAISQKRDMTEKVFLKHAVGMVRRLAFKPGSKMHVELYGAIGRSLLVSKNPKLAFDILALACGLNVVRGFSIRQRAPMYGITPQAISKRAVALRKKLGLPQSLGGKSEAACEKYRICNVRNYGSR